MFPAALLSFVQDAPAPPAPPQGTEADAAFATLRWLGVQALPGYRVLDCRPLSLSMSSMTSNPDVAARFAQLRDDDGARLRDTTITDALELACDIPIAGFAKPDGAVFRAPEMEWKWDVSRVGDRLYFTRSWTGDLKLIARIDGERIVQISLERSACANDARTATAFAQSMALVYLQAKLAPHPVPPDFAGTTPREIYLYSFSVHGRAAFFAAPMRGLPP